MNKISIGNDEYELVVVTDSLAKITEAISIAIDRYAHCKPVALDFSTLRPRGEATSHTGKASGPASFIKSLDGMIKAISHDVGKTYYEPVIILLKTHKDFDEYKELAPEATILLQKDNEGNISRMEGRLKPYWQLSATELERAIKKRKKRAEL